MEQKKEINSSEFVTDEELNDIFFDVSENITVDSTSIKAKSILVSVNAVRTPAENKESADDNLLDNEVELYECNSEDILITQEKHENAPELTDNGFSFILDIAQETVQPHEDDADLNAAYDVDEFEDDDPDSDNGEKKRISAKKVGCLSCSAVLLLMMILLVSVTAVFYHYYRMMDIDEDDSVYFNTKVTFSDTEISEIPDGDVVIQDGTVFKDTEVFNILLIGTDERTNGFSKNARADSIMLLSLDNSTKTIRLVSLERGMLVSIPGHKNDILTHTFRYGGSKLLMQTVRTHFKVDVDKYIRVNFSMFQKLVDEVGGVDVTLTEKEAYGLNTSSNHNTWKIKRKVHAGINHFDGYEALQYARLRWIDDDFHRIERQRKMIIAIKENLTGLSVSDLKDISADCLPYVQTNLTAIEFADLLIRMPGYFDNEVVQMTIPKKGTYKTLGHVDFNENSKILNEFLYGSKFTDK